MMLTRPKLVPTCLGAEYGAIRRLDEDWSVTLWPFTFHIYSGFVTDGASVPNVLRPLAGDPFDWPRLAAAIVHDWLYASHLLPRWIADIVFLFILLVVGYPFARSMADYLAVARFGRAAWDSHGENDQRYARAHGRISICYNNKKRKVKNK